MAGGRLSCRPACQSDCARRRGQAERLSRARPFSALSARLSAARFIISCPAATPASAPISTLPAFCGRHSARLSWLRLSGPSPAAARFSFLAQTKSAGSLDWLPAFFWVPKSGAGNTGLNPPCFKKQFPAFAGSKTASKFIFAREGGSLPFKARGFSPVFPAPLFGTATPSATENRRRGP